MNEPPDWSDERLARLIAASRGECARIASSLPTQRSPSAEVTSRTSRPLVSERVVVSSTRLAPMRSISARTASAAGLP